MQYQTGMVIYWQYQSKPVCRKYHLFRLLSPLILNSLLLTLSQGNVEAIRLAFAVTPYLIKLVHRKISIQPIPQFLIYNIFWTMGNICFNDPTLRYELVWLDLVATSLSFVELCHCAASTLAMTCWFLSIFADSRLPLQLLQG